MGINETKTDTVSLPGGVEAADTNLSNLDSGAGVNIKTAYEAEANTNAFTDSEQTKLSGIATGATANDTDANLRDRSTHTGTQTLSTISDAGSLAAKNSVATGDIDDDAVTYAKMQNVSATDRILGRDTAGAGNVEEITPAALRTMINVADGATANDTDANLKARANHTGTQTASTISDFDTEVSNNASVTANTAKVSNATHTGDVTGSTALTIANSAVTYTKIQNISTTDRILGRDSAGAGVVEEISPAALRTMINVEDGATADQSDAEIKTAYENNANTNAYTDAEKTTVSNQSGTNTGDEVAATESVAGILEIATQAETDAGTDDVRALTALKLENSSQLADKVVGPASATNLGIAAFNGTTGKLLFSPFPTIESNNIVGNTGTAASPAFRPNSSNMGMYRTGSNTLGFSTAGSPQLEFSASLFKIYPASIEPDTDNTGSIGTQTNRFSTSWIGTMNSSNISLIDTSDIIKMSYIGRATVQTTNGTEINALNISLANSETITVTTRVCARRSGGTAGADGDSAAYSRTIVAKKDSVGTFSKSAAQDNHADIEDQAGWNFRYDDNGSQLQIKFTGALDNTVEWFYITEIISNK